MSKARNIADLGSNDVLDTNANGLDVTGNVNINSNTSSASTANQLTLRGGTGNVVSGNVVGGINFDSFDLGNQNTSASISAVASGGHVSGSSLDTDLIFKTADGASVVNRLNIGHNGDIIMYKDDGTTAGVTFDASTGYTTFDGYVTVNNSVDLNGTLFPNSIFMADSQAIVFGTGSDAELSWGGSYLNLNTKGNDIRIMDGLTTKVHYDASSNSLGIGIDNPQAELHIHDPAGHAKIRLSGTAADADTFEIYQGITGVTNGGLTIRDVEASADRLVINSSGNVGISTNNPTAKLQVEGTLAIRSSSSQYFNDSNNANNLTMTDSKAHFNFDGTDKDFQVSSDNLSHALFVKGSDGSVGVGESNPEHQLEVKRATGKLARFVTQDDNNGATNPLSINYNASLRLDNQYSGASPSVNGTKVAKIQLSTVTRSGYGAYGAIVVDADTGTGFNSGEMSFALGANSSNLMTEVMRVNRSGYVTTPYQPAFKANATTQTNLGSNWQKVLYGNSVTARNGTGSTAYANSRFTAPVAGWYFFSASYSATANADADGTLSIGINGSQSNLVSSTTAPSTSGHTYNPHFCSGTAYLAAGDFVEVYRYATVTTTTRTGVAYGGWFSGFLTG